MGIVGMGGRSLNDGGVGTYSDPVREDVLDSGLVDGGSNQGVNAISVVAGV